MKKKVFVIICALTFTIGLVACGTAEPAKNYSDSIDYNENMSYEDSTVEYSEAAKNDSIELVTNESNNSSNETEMTRSTSKNIEDYWKGSDYFDLEGYITANDCVHYEYDYLDDGTNNGSIEIVTKDCNWLICVPIGSSSSNTPYNAIIAIYDKEGNCVSSINSKSNTTQVRINTISDCTGNEVIPLLIEILSVCNNTPAEIESCPICQEPGNIAHLHME